MDFAAQQAGDPGCAPLLNFLVHEKLPDDPSMARQISAQAPMFDVVDGILCFVGHKANERGRRVVSCQLRRYLMEGYHGSLLSGHFSGPKLCLDTGGGKACTVTSRTIVQHVLNA